jgi:hypothetical protein
MVRAMIPHFDRIWSIELGERLYVDATDRFRDASHVHLIHGDSGRELGRLLSQLDAPALIWLDAHFSGGPLRGATSAREDKDTPILEELDHILTTPASLGAIPRFPRERRLRRLCEHEARTAV